MPAYRLYVLGGAGNKITGAEWIAADTDEQAVAFARTKRISVRCELWDRNRLVAEIPAPRS